MKRIKENLSEQGILFSNHYVGDRLEENDEVYLFKDLIHKLDTSAITNSYSPEGGSMFAPIDQLAVITFALFRGITSSMMMADLVRHHLQFIYLAGGHIIKRRTICDFRIKHKENIRKIFESTVDLAIDSGLVREDQLFALDGAKIEANASFSKTRKKKEWKERQEKIVEHVDKFLEEWEKQDELEEGLEEKRREEFEKIKKKIDQIKIEEENKKKQSDENPKENKKSTINKKKSSNSKKKEKGSKAVYKKNKITINNSEDAEKLLKEHDKIDSLLDYHKNSDEEMFLSLTEPDSRVMQSDSITKECFNAQAISNNQVIVAADVTQDENDQGQLEPMVEQMKKNIKLEEDKEEKIPFASDAGYNKGKNLEYLDKEKSIDPYVSMFDRSGKNDLEENKFHKENFIFDEENEYWICPEGEKLEFMKEHLKDGKKYTLYGCQLKKCIYCPHKDECVTTKEDVKRGYRTIDDDGYLIYRKEMRKKMELESSKKIYAKRSGCVEPVFGQIKNNRGMKRFKLKGLSKVKAEFLYMAIAHNLGKIMKHKMAMR